MIRLNDYLYSGDTIFGILNKYRTDLKKNAEVTGSSIDLAHAEFLRRMSDTLERHDFLAEQSHKMKDFYQFIAREYPWIAFAFKGRIKSLVRAETKFNAHIMEYVYDYYQEHGTYPTQDEMMEHPGNFRDMIAYRIVISIPPGNMMAGADVHDEEMRCLYRIANLLPKFMEERGFTPLPACTEEKKTSHRMSPEVRPYYRDYVMNPNQSGYRSLHISLYDNSAKCSVEVQLRTKEMDDYAEIGAANHFGYEKKQAEERINHGSIPKGACQFYDEACERVLGLQNLELAKLYVNMFSAVDNYLINDCCGLYRGRLILPYEHLSHRQVD